MPSAQGLDAYRRESAGKAEYASPHELTAMLFTGALERLAQARGAMQRGQVAQKGEQLGKAISILDGLRASLNHDAGGDLAGNLARLYSYMQERLLVANLHDDSDALDEVVRLLKEIKSGWDQIAPETP